MQAIATAIGRPLTQEEFVECWNGHLEAYMRGVSYTSAASKLTAATVALLAYQDVEIASKTAVTAIDNNFVVLAVYGVVAANIAYSAYEIHNAYQEGGSTAALKQLGIEVVLDVAGAAACHAAGKVLAKLGV